MATSLFRNIAANLAHPEHGWKTTHFWGPVANWGIVAAAVYGKAEIYRHTFSCRLINSLYTYMLK